MTEPSRPKIKLGRDWYEVDTHENPAFLPKGYVCLFIIGMSEKPVYIPKEVLDRIAEGGKNGV